MARDLLSSFAVVIVVLFLLVPSFAEELPPNRQLNQSGCSDLAIGVPGDTAGAVAGAGAVNVLFGVATLGLDDAGNELYNKTDFIGQTPAAGDSFGWALATGDFNGDHLDDLAVGAPGETVGGDFEAGRLYTYRGRSWGLTPAGIWDQDSGTVSCCAAEAEDFFAYALAAGDFNGDGFDDLAVGAWGESLGSLDDAGGVHIFTGDESGLTSVNNQWWTQGSSNIAGTAEAGDRFGFALAAGDFNRDGFDDLVIGVPGENNNTGVVHVLYGSAGYLSSTGSQTWDQDDVDGVGARLQNEYFGWALTTGDFNGDGFDDFAVSAPFENLPPGIGSAGVVHVFYGSAGGITAVGSQTWSQDSDGIQGSAETSDRFGFRLAAGDFNHDHCDDLVVGVPYEDHSGPPFLESAGLVQVLYGSLAGITANDDYWHQDTTGVIDPAGEYNYFGDAVAVGDFNCDLYDDLVIGVPGEEFDDPPDSGHEGAINVLYGSASGLTTDGTQFWAQYYSWVTGTAEDDDRFGKALAATRGPLIFDDGFEFGNPSRWD